VRTVVSGSFGSGRVRVSRVSGCVLQLTRRRTGLLVHTRGEAKSIAAGELCRYAAAVVPTLRKSALMKSFARCTLTLVVVSILAIGYDTVAGSDRSLTVASDSSSAQVNQADVAYLEFGKVIRAETTTAFDRTNNLHTVAAHAVARCAAGQVSELLEEMPQVETDVDTGSALATFVSEFCPNLTRYDDRTLYLRFEGYRASPTTTDWYYYIVDQTGTQLEGNPWVSLHRSRVTQQTALTGILLPTPGEPQPPLPTDLLRRKL
jgi:hypothetical protein